MSSVSLQPRWSIRKNTGEFLPPFGFGPLRILRNQNFHDNTKISQPTFPLPPFTSRPTARHVIPSPCTLSPLDLFEQFVSVGCLGWSLEVKRFCSHQVNKLRRDCLTGQNPWVKGTPIKSATKSPMQSYSPKRPRPALPPPTHLSSVRW